MKRLVLLASFIFGNLSILLTSFLFLTVYSPKETAALPSPPLEILQPELVEEISSPSAVLPLPAVLSGSIAAADARPLIVDDFFRKYASLMTGLGREIVLAADRYQIPYGYLPAIAQCEGNLGRAMPPNSHNTWGWGIYGDLVTAFPTWQYAIDAVSKGLKEEYFNKGLNTPEKIMPKYAPPSNGSWAVCVQKYLRELQ